MRKLIACFAALLFGGSQCIENGFIYIQLCRSSTAKNRNRHNKSAKDLHKYPQF